jgi:hypothetical protein
MVHGQLNRLKVIEFVVKQNQNRKLVKEKIDSLLLFETPRKNVSGQREGGHHRTEILRLAISAKSLGNRTVLLST